MASKLIEQEMTVGNKTKHVVSKLSAEPKISLHPSQEAKRKEGQLLWCHKQLSSNAKLDDSLISQNKGLVKVDKKNKKMRIKKRQVSSSSSYFERIMLIWTGKSSYRLIYETYLTVSLSKEPFEEVGKTQKIVMSTTREETSLLESVLALPKAKAMGSLFVWTTQSCYANELDRCFAAFLATVAAAAAATASDGNLVSMARLYYKKKELGVLVVALVERRRYIQKVSLNGRERPRVDSKEEEEEGEELLSRGQFMLLVAICAIQSLYLIRQYNGSRLQIGRLPVRCLTSSSAAKSCWIITTERQQQQQRRRRSIKERIGERWKNPAPSNNCAIRFISEIRLEARQTNGRITLTLVLVLNSQKNGKIKATITTILCSSEQNNLPKNADCDLELSPTKRKQRVKKCRYQERRPNSACLLVRRLKFLIREETYIDVFKNIKQFNDVKLLKERIGHEEIVIWNIIGSLRRREGGDVLLSPKSALPSRIQNVFTVNFRSLESRIKMRIRNFPFQVKKITLGPFNSSNTATLDKLYGIEFDITSRKLLVEDKLTKKMFEWSFRHVEAKQREETSSLIARARTRIRTSQKMTTTTTVTTKAIEIEIDGRGESVTMSAVIANTMTISTTRKDLNVITVSIELAPISSSTIDLGQARECPIIKEFCCTQRLLQRLLQQQQQQQFRRCWLANCGNSASIASLIGRNRAARIQFAGSICCECCSGLKLERKPLAPIHQPFGDRGDRQGSRVERSLEWVKTKTKTKTRTRMKSKKGRRSKTKTKTKTKTSCELKKQRKEEKRKSLPGESECHLASFSIGLKRVARLSTITPAASTITTTITANAVASFATVARVVAKVATRIKRQADRSKKRYPPREWSTTMRPTFDRRRWTKARGLKSETASNSGDGGGGVRNTTTTFAETSTIVAVQNVSQSLAWQPSSSNGHLTKSGSMQAVVIFCLLVVCFATELVTGLARDVKRQLNSSLDFDVQKKRLEKRKQHQLQKRSTQQLGTWSEYGCEEEKEKEKEKESECECESKCSNEERTHNRFNSMIDYTAEPMSKCDKRQLQVTIPSSSLNSGSGLSLSSNSNLNSNASLEQTLLSASFWLLLLLPVIAISHSSRPIKPLEDRKLVKGRVQHKHRHQMGVPVVRAIILASLFVCCIFRVIDTTNPGVIGSSSPFATGKSFSQSNLIAAEEEGEASSKIGHDTTKIKGQSPAKLDFWRLLLQPVLSDISSEGINLEAVSELAFKLASWPDQKRATLLYLDLLAERRDRMNNFEQQTSSSNLSDFICRRASLAELEASETDIKHLQELSNQANTAEQSKAIWPSLTSNIKHSKNSDEELSNSAIFTLQQQTASSYVNKMKLKQFISLNELNKEKERDKGIVEKLYRQRNFSDLSKLAVENANLISRLLIFSNENEIIKQIVSKQKFFKYLLSSKVVQVSTSEQTYSNYLHSLGLIFLDDDNNNTVNDETNISGDSGDFIEKSEHQQSSGDKLDGLQARLGNSRIKFSPIAISNNVGLPILLDLAKHSVASNRNSPNGYFEVNGGQSQAFVAKWLLADELGELNPLEQRLKALSIVNNDKQHQQQQQQQQADKDNLLDSSINLNLDDGRWFSPYFDCGVSNTWLLTYSVPFFASSSRGKSKQDNRDGGDEAEEEEENSQDKQRVVKLRGVSFVNLNLGPMKLIDQCASGDDQNGAFLANTHQCSRLELSQCVRLEQVEEVRSGAYVCQCPVGGSVSPNERLATENWRDQLAEQVNSASSLNKNSTFERLALELDEQLGDKLYVANQLRLQQRQKYHHQQRQGRLKRPEWQTSKQYFALGSQLDSDAALDWFTGGRESWPQQICRLCKRMHHGNNNTAITNQSINLASEGGGGNNNNEKNNGKQVNALEVSTFCSSEFEQPNTRWIRPLVLVIQSICVLITLALIAILLRVRKSRIIIVSGWLMLETTLVGALILYSSVFVRYFEPTSITCLLEPWLRELGFSIFYGSILIKLYRILTEFQTRKAHRVCFRDKDQIVYLLAIVLIVVGYMSAWTALMVDGFFFSRQNSPTTVTNSPQHNLASDTNNIAQIASSLSLQTTSSSNHHFEHQLSRNQPIDQNLLFANSVVKEEEQQRRQEQHFRESEINPRISNESDSSSSTLLNNSVNGSKDRNKESFLVAKNRTLDETNNLKRQQQPSARFNINLNYDINENNNNNNNNIYNFHESTKSSSLILNDNSSISSAFEDVGQFSSWAPSLGELFTQNLNSFSDLFSSLLESERQYDEFNDLLTYSMRCRKLTWDYVTELSEMGLLLFGIYLVYKLRNASSEVYKEKLILSASLFIELFISALAYSIRHLFWNRLTSDQILILYCLRCQLTVTLTVVLVFVPKLWTIGKSKPALFSNSRSMNAQGGSMRHRCHISCEIHDHHLNDAMRLHQAMLSNAALDIGSINLADMDPDEIQAELKRVYAQLEVLKTKAMRRDNPHISKRRGGRAKTGHRKFSLQAFHAKHLGGHHTHSSSSTTTSHNQQNQNQNQNQHQNHQQRRSNKDDPNGATYTQIEIHDAAASDKSFVVDHKKLPVVEENELKHGSGEELEIDNIKTNNQEQMVSAVSLSDKTSNTKLSALGKLGANEQRRVRVDDHRLAESNLTNATNNNNGVITNSTNLHYRHQHQHHQQQQQQHNIRHQSGSGSHPQHHHRCHHHHNHHHHHHHQQQQQQQHHQPNKNSHTNDNHKNNSSAIPTTADPNSTSSACVYFDDDTLILNDSQSSENVSPQRQSSFVCSQSSVHREDSSLN